MLFPLPGALLFFGCPSPLAGGRAVSEQVPAVVDDVLKTYVVPWLLMYLEWGFHLYSSKASMAYLCIEEKIETLHNHTHDLEPVNAQRPEATSAEAAIQQAKGAASIAVWSNAKVTLQGVGNVGKTQRGNRGRDLANHLHKRGFMLNIPISWLKRVFWQKHFAIF